MNIIWVAQFVNSFPKRKLAKYKCRREIYIHSDISLILGRRHILRHTSFSINIVLLDEFEDHKIISYTPVCLPSSSLSSFGLGGRCPFSLSLSGRSNLLGWRFSSSRSRGLSTFPGAPASLRRGFRDRGSSGRLSWRLRRHNEAVIRLRSL